MASAACGSPSRRSTRARAMRDLPMPGSPESSTTWPSPSQACCQRSSRSATSCSRPTSGVRARPRARLEAAADRALAEHPRTPRTGSAKPLSDSGPRSASSNAADQPPRRRGDHDGAGPASSCRRAARFGVSPTTASLSRRALAHESPTTTSPVAIPTRAASGSPAGVVRRRRPRRPRARPAPRARPRPRAPRPAEVGQHPSPMNFATCPSKRATSPATAFW